MSKQSWAYIIAPVVAWLVAQVIKVVLAAQRTGKNDLSVFFKSGNMPSSHTAITLALLTVLAVREGLDSSLFGVAAIFTAIVIYDAVNVRRAVGEQGDMLKKVMKINGLKEVFYTAHGHRLADICAGAVIGILSGALMLQIL